MEARAERMHRLREHVPHLHITHRATAAPSMLDGIVAGIGGGLVLAAPLVIYDWARAGHSALELPMAATGWLFGLNHYARNAYHWWPIVIGALCLLAYWGVQGIAFTSLASRVYRVRTLMGSVVLGGVWSFVSFMFFWYMLLPIARGGAPFRVTAVAPGSLVAPDWVWILGFTLAGLATGVCYRLLGTRESTQTATTTTTTQQVA